MRRIINHLYELPDFDSTRLAMYIRCLLQAILPFDQKLALKLAEETCKMVKDAAEVS
jgi:hypothetical protein